MFRLIACLLISASIASAQSLFDASARCAKSRGWDQLGTWSPDCESYFVNGRRSMGFPTDEIRISSLARSIVVYTIRGKTTYIGDPTREVRRNLAASHGVSCPFVNVEGLKWLGSRRLLLRADLICGRDGDFHNVLYEVDAQSGQIKRSPAQLTRSPKQ